MLTRSFFVIKEPLLTLEPTDGTVGTDITISGEGFYSGRAVTLYYHNIVGEKISEETATTIGEFTHAFTIPNSTAGEHTFIATNAQGNSAEAMFEVIPSIDLSASSAGPGELLTVKGTGFSNKTDVEITFGIYSVAKARTSEFGDFSAIFNVPELGPGNYDIKAKDDDGNTARGKFVTTAGARVEPATGAVGSQLTVSGSGFKVGGTVTVSYDNLNITSVTTDNNGAFTTYFNVPKSTGGSHVVTISDGTTTRQFAFTVESEAPAPPELLLPANNTETGAGAYLDWKDSSDPSLPIVYDLQIARDQNFAAPVVQKKGLTGSEYTLAEDEMLAAVPGDTPYFWRIKAIDSAGNQGEWSPPRSFYVSPPAVPVLVLPPSDSQPERPVSFYWQGVSSLTPPVVYAIQVANDLNFSTLVLEQDGLTSTQYTITEEEALPDTKKESPYYWRIKAVDGAGNEGEWSTPWSFYLGTPFAMPVWAIIILIVIGAGGVGFLAFWAGRRTAFRPPE
jgi:hypothetical protein